MDKALLRIAFLYCKEVRARYTILQPLRKPGVLEDVTGTVLAELQ